MRKYIKLIKVIEMKVLIIARGYPTVKYKMNGIFEFDQARALTKMGVDVVYAAIDMRSFRRWRKWGIEKKIIEGVKVYAINIPCGRIPKRILYGVGLSGLKYLYSKIVKEQGEPDVIHSHFAAINYIAGKFKSSIGIPVVMTEHLSAMMNSDIDTLLFDIAGSAYSNADRLITVSPELKSIIEKRFNIEAEYIPNIVDTTLFRFEPQNLINDSTFKFISIGGLIERKRMDLTIESFIKVFKNNDKVSLTIFGEGPERPKLEELIKENKMEERITLMGMQSRKDISEYLKESDCFVLASQAETFGVVYIEALACGVPVIGTKCGGPESFVDKNNGILIPTNKQEALEEAMIYMYQNIDKYQRENISSQTNELFSEEIVANKIMGIYRSVTTNQKRN